MRREESEIVEFFTGKCVFVTGGTGYVGKATIEKLLRACPEVRRILILIRSKRDVDPDTRLESLLNEPKFDVLRQLQPQFAKKVAAIPGDISLPNMGIRNADLLLLQENVSVVIHCAATVKFNEALRIVLNVNLKGTQRVMQVAKTMRLLKAVVYLSTAFSNCDRPFIEEKVYPASIDPFVALYLIENLNDDLVDSFTPRLVGDKPNTYTFSKHLAELLITEWHTELPLCIVRRSIITGAQREPVPGFVDNFNAMSGVLAGVMTGCIHSLHFNDECKIDTIPLDYVVNLTLAAVCQLGRSKNRSDLQIYNLTSFENRMKCDDVVSGILEVCYTKPLTKLLRYPTLRVTCKPKLYSLYRLTLHWLPAFGMDLLCGLVGKKKMFMNIHDKIYRNMGSMEYFSINKWTILSDNTKALYNSLNHEDKLLFAFNVQEIDWVSYIKDYVSGIRTYAFKQTDESVKDGKKLLLKLR